jgi:hypothetical protein
LAVPLSFTHESNLRNFPRLQCLLRVIAGGGALVGQLRYCGHDEFRRRAIDWPSVWLCGGWDYLRSFGFQQDINNNELLMPTGTNGVRWEDASNDPTGGAADRFDWASGSAGAAILSAGGFIVTSDWIPVETTLQARVSFQVGTVNADNGNLTNDDYGILFRNAGGTERIDNSVNLGAGGTFGASAGGVVREIEIVYSFGSFADGSSVNAISSVDGTQVANDTFTWDSNAGQM